MLSDKERLGLIEESLDIVKGFGKKLASSIESVQINFGDEAVEELWDNYSTLFWVGRNLEKLKKEVIERHEKLLSLSKKYKFTFKNKDNDEVLLITAENIENAIELLGKVVKSNGTWEISCA